VPLTREITYIDMFARWHAPVVLCARTTLGTINHTLLSIEAIRARDIALLGVAFIGDENVDSEAIIVELGRTRRLGRLPLLSRLTPETLRAAFAAQFNVSDFLKDNP
jgi:dethiobiotin synthetase